MGLYYSKEVERNKEIDNEIDKEYDIINSNKEDIKYEYIPYDGKNQLKRKYKFKSDINGIIKQSIYLGTLNLDRDIELYTLIVHTYKFTRIYKLDNKYCKSLKIYLKSLKYNIEKYKIEINKVIEVLEKDIKNTNRIKVLKDRIIHNESVYKNVKIKNGYKK